MTVFNPHSVPFIFTLILPHLPWQRRFIWPVTDIHCIVLPTHCVVCSLYLMYSTQTHTQTDKQTDRHCTVEVLLFHH